MRTLPALLIAAALTLATPASATQVYPLSLDETIRQADAIVLGTVISKNTRWGDASRRFMFTDYEVAIEDVLYASAGGPMTGTTATLSYWGGTLEGETQAVSEVRVPLVGERIVAMLRPGWNTEPGFTPVVGFNHGLFGAQGQGASATLLDAEDQPLLRTGNRIARQGTLPGHVAEGESVGLDSFAAWVRANASAIKAMPSEMPDASFAGDSRVLRTFAKSPGPLAIRADVNAPAPVVESLLPLGSVAGASPGTPSAAASKYSYFAAPPGTMVFNSFPASFAPWTPEDQYQMSKWNYYAGNTFRVYTTPTGTFAWPDGVFDLTGWPSSATMAAVYGAGWDANTIAVAWTRTNGSGVIIESDISFNPAWSYTLDDDWVYSGSGGVQGFRQVMLHELGHAFGLNHQFNFLSVMNYMPSPFRAYAFPYADDTQAIRAGYPGTAVALTDIGVYFFRATGYQGVAAATHPSSVLRGSSLQLSNFHVENAGTVAVSQPVIEWYLTSNRDFTQPYYFLGQHAVPYSLPSFTYVIASQDLAVPSSVPPGAYYIGAFIRDDGGAGQGSFPHSNNFAFTRNRVQVLVPTIGLEVLKSGAGSGTITSQPAGVNCGPGCNGQVVQFEAGAQVTLTVTREPGSAFVGWSGDGCSGTGDCVITMDVARDVWAQFEPATNVFPAGCAMPTGFTVPAAANAGWSVAFDQAYEGSCSLKSNPIGHSQRAQIEYAGTFAAGNVTFRRRVASEPNYDYFRFYIDGVEQAPATASGSPATFRTEWTTPAELLSFPITAGTHTITFSYEKDGSVVQATDAAWIDALTLPLAASAPRPRDANGDGRSDIFWRDSGGQLALWLMNGDTFMESAVLMGASTGWNAIANKDFNGDGRADILWQHASGSVALWLMNGTGASATGLLLGSPGGWAVTQVADFNGDAKADLLWRHTDGRIAIWLMDGLAVTGAGVLFDQGAWAVTHTPDLNGDGRADLLFRNASTSQTAAWLLDGLTVLGQGVIAGNPVVTHTGDVNGDGRHDLIASSAGGVSIHLMDGTATLAAQAFPAGAFQVQHAADFNGDGRLDLLFNDAGGQVAIWLLDGLTLLDARIVFTGGGGWTVTHTGDYNGDGSSDLLWRDRTGQAAIWIMQGMNAQSASLIFNGAGGWLATL